MSLHVPETVVLIHGTGAATGTIDGSAWWHPTSAFCAKLQARFPGRKFEFGEVFLWSGENKESDRRAAGLKLLTEFIIPLEKKGRPYHLIGHSHGGSVIWHALRFAEEFRFSPVFLLSWCTVGTPFFQYGHERFSLSRMMFYIAPITLLLVALYGIYLLAQRWAEGILWQVDYLTGIATIVAFLFLAWLSWMAIKFVSIDCEYQLSERTMAEFGERWLGVRSSQDEAINSLKHATSAPMQIAPRMATFRHLRQQWRDKWKMSSRTIPVLVRDSGFFSYFSPIIFICFELIALPDYAVRFLGVGPFFNYVCAGFIDSIIWSSAKKTALGLDDSSVVLAVLDGPVTAASPDAYIPLPNHVDENLVKLANQSANELIPKIRKQLGTSAMTCAVIPDLIWRVSGNLTWGELVHTSYFDDAEVLEIIFLNLDVFDPWHSTSVTDFGDDHLRWHTSFRAGVRSHVMNKLKMTS